MEPRLTDGVLDEDPRSFEHFDRVIRPRMLRGDFVRVKVWRPDGHIVYSDLPALRGADFGLDEEERRVLATSGVEAEVSDLSKSENRVDDLAKDHGLPGAIYVASYSARQRTSLRSSTAPDAVRNSSRARPRRSSMRSAP